MNNVKVIASSSKGNCYLLNGTLLIECGVRLSEIKKALNYDLSKVVACLITHEHQDHCKAVEGLMSLGVDVYMSKGTADKLCLSGHRVKIIKANIKFDIANYTILPFDVQHDVAEPLGFLIRDNGTKFKCLYATDTYYLKYKFKEVDAFIIECNYIQKILDYNIEKGHLHPIHAKRVTKSHFSLTNLIKFLLSSDLSRTTRVVLIHLSAGNSNARMMKHNIEKHTGIQTHVADSGMDIEL